MTQTRQKSLMHKILLHAPCPQDGTSYYRGWNPFKKLKNVEVIAAPKGWITWNDLIDIDVVVFQRPASVKEVLDIETCKAYGVPVWVDWDDNGMEVQDDNPAYEFYRRDVVGACLKTIAKLADVVTVTTQGLKEAVLEWAPEANVVIIPNAVDDYMFSVDFSDHKREKIITLRGGGSHTKDWELYKDGILAILAKHPEYKLAVFGHHPDFLRQIPAHQIQYFKFTTIEAYFDTLLQLRPEIMLVPLQDNKFNRSKSAIALYEGAIAGAVTVASYLPEFDKYGACWFDSNEVLESVIHDIIKDKEVWSFYYEVQRRMLPVLSEVNEDRLNVIETLISRRKKKAPYTKTLPPATDLEFHEYALSHGHTQDDPQYAEAHSKLAEWLIKTTNCKTSVELGSGTGATLVELLKRGVMAYGWEINPHSVQYFKDHYPMYENQVSLVDLTKESLDTDAVGDLVMSIEVFEHINMPEEWWISFLTDLSTKFRYFYFTSTPYSDPEAFMSFWHHVAVKRTTDWIKMFKATGWQFVSNPKVITSWDCFFKSKNL
jgi:2-polyprenyl-3-methyl-5-hydroxy-6-metoxy-1,4-benzoquinol methylase